MGCDAGEGGGGGSCCREGGIGGLGDSCELD